MKYGYQINLIIFSLHPNLKVPYDFLCIFKPQEIYFLGLRKCTGNRRGTFKLGQREYYLLHLVLTAELGYQTILSRPIMYIVLHVEKNFR